MKQPNNMRILDSNKIGLFLKWYSLYKSPSKATLETVKYHAKALLQSCINGKEINLENCNEYITQLRNKEASGVLTTNTVYSYVKILKSVIEFTCILDPTFEDLRPKLPKIKRHETPIMPLTTQEIELIINTPIQKMGHQRDYVLYNALFSLLAYSGRRISEIAKLKVADIDLDSKFILLRSPKGGNPEWIPLPSGAIVPLNEHLNTKRRGVYLFPSPRADTPITRQTVSLELKRRAKEVGVHKPVNPHNFRHSFARPLLKMKVPLNVVKDLLGHKSINTTMRYTHMMPEDLKESSNLHPGNRAGITGSQIAELLLNYIDIYRGAKESFVFDTKTEKNKLEIVFTWRDEV